MKLSIDCRFLGKSGIGTFLENILNELLCNHPENQYVLIMNKKQLWNKKYPNVTIVRTSIKSFTLKELFSFPTHEINNCDAFFSPYINIPGGIKVPVFSTVHDVIFLDIPNLVSRVGLIIRKWFINRAIRLSKYVFTVSEFSKSRIQYYFGFQKPIHIIYNSIPAHIRDYQISESPNKEDCYIYVGNIKPHKGLITLVKAFELAQKEGLTSRLLLVGEADKFRTSEQELDELLHRIKNVEFTGWVDNDRLCQLIAKSKALVLPSMYEGFGIPPMEAMYLGTKAIVSDIPILKEIYSDFPVSFFKMGNELDLKNKLLTTNTQIDRNSIRKEIDTKYNITDAVNKLLSVAYQNN